MNTGRLLALEVVLVLLCLLGGLHGSSTALETALARVGAAAVDAEAVRLQLHHAWLAFGGGLLAMLAGRLIGLARSRAEPIDAWLLLPSVAAATALGLALQSGYGDPVVRPEAAWDFGKGVLLGGVTAGVLLGVDWSPGQSARRLKWWLLGFVAVVFVALGLFGYGPKGTDTHINLAGTQPLELAKPAFVAFLAAVMGSRAAELRAQRVRLASYGLRQVPGLRAVAVPPLRWLFWPLAGSAALYLLLFLVGDLGPVLVLALVLILLWLATTRAWSLLTAATLPIVIGLVLLALIPDLGPQRVHTRLDMVFHPWTNGHPNGMQLARGLWALGAGGLWGQGLGDAFPGGLQLGHNDFVLAHLGEELGWRGLLIWQLAFAALVLQCLRIGASARRVEGQLLATGLGLLFVAQGLVIFFGVTGWLPLTGIVTPFLSAGASGLAAMIALVGIVGRIAAEGRVPEPPSEQAELRLGVESTTLVVAALLGLALFKGYDVTVRSGDAHLVQPLVTRGGDGGVLIRQDPRLRAIANRIPRGELRDRDGRVLATTDATGVRRYPLGEDLGTLLGWPDPGSRMWRPSWALERVHEQRLVGLEPASPAIGAWVVDRPPRPQLLLAVKDGEARDVDRTRAEAMAAPGERVFFFRPPQADYSALLRLLHMRPESRDEAVAALVADVDSRSVSLTFDARLQERVARILRQTAKRGKAAAAVVLDVDSGEVLARVQVPDLDPSTTSWRAKLRSKDPAFVGVYGPFVDKTGIRGVYQSGSIGKLFTALAWARRAEAVRGRQCGAESDLHHACDRRDADGPYFERPGWMRPIHDFRTDPLHGAVGVAEGLEVSCNVFFGQLALDLGTDALAALADDGLGVGWSEQPFEPGPDGSRRLASTGFGQGAMAMNVSQAARLVATVAGGGVYRRCPWSHQLGEDCKETVLVREERRLGPILSGMRRVMGPTGTGKDLRSPAGVRVYGKTGTADDPIRLEERPFGLRRGGPARPHSWFVAFAEEEAGRECEIERRRRVAVAVVVPRGGMGAAAAGPATMEILEAVRDLGLLGGP